MGVQFHQQQYSTVRFKGAMSQKDFEEIQSLIDQVPVLEPYRDFISIENSRSLESPIYKSLKFWLTIPFLMIPSLLDVLHNNKVAKNVKNTGTPAVFLMLMKFPTDQLDELEFSNPYKGKPPCLKNGTFATGRVNRGDVWLSWQIHEPD